MNKIKKLIYFLVLSQFIISSSGCYVIGTKIGASSDSKKLPHMEIPGDEIFNLPTNTKMQIYFKDGQYKEGQFLKVNEPKNLDQSSKTLIWYEKGCYLQQKTPTSEIDCIVINQKRNGKWIGFIIGIGLDAIGLYVFTKDAHIGL
jgi:hypothetical protein